VTSWHCLEHVYDPVAELKEISRITRPGGWLQIEVPTPTVLAWIFRGRWLFLQAPTHLYHYRPTALARLVQDAGFEVKRIYRPFLLSELAGSLVLLTGLKGFAPKMLFKSRPFRYKLLSSLFYLLLVADIPVTGLMAWLGKSGNCRLIAQKR
jgi:SAM-dependent methyltransferase